MKSRLVKMFLPAIAFLFLIVAQACNQSKKKQENVHTEHHGETQHEKHDENDDSNGHSHDEAHGHADFELELILNNGKKWQADKPTTRNAKSLIAIGNEFSKNNQKELKDYHMFGSEVEAGINKMIRECTMKGKPDEMLHIWFFPILKGAENLKEAEGTSGLAAMSSRMIERLRIYDDYFEYN